MSAFVRPMGSEALLEWIAEHRKSRDMGIRGRQGKEKGENVTVIHEG
ncbi:hypothetical protein [Mesorhizobium prunaredense]|nr:hypothetical protein [Mesorhizobium prunaredense]